MDVFKKDGQYYAVCPDDRIDPKPLTDDDIARYRFNLDPLIEKIRKANGLDGSDYSLTPRLYFIGERLVSDVNTAFVLALFPDIATAEPHLLSLLSRIPSHCPQTVVVAPSLSLTSEPVYSKLISAAIFPVILPGDFGKGGFGLSYLATMRKKIPVGAAPKVSPLTKKQVADKEKYGYRCQDRIHIPGTTPSERKNEVIINGHKVFIGDKLFALLLRLVAELKKGKGGWIESADLVAEHFINDIEHRQPFSHLRHAFKPWLIEGDGKHLIESSRSNQYRLSTHPEFVTCDMKKLRAHPYDDIKKLAEALQSGVFQR
ncbi:MAG: hypothetical protein PHN82_06390 [bacterium]|nr:hypothetical protein [bacterium]